MIRIVSSLAGLIVALALSGCVPLLIGGAAAGGYYIGQDDRSAGTIAEDGAITTRVKSKFVGDRYVDAFAINVDTRAGVVTLNGHVATRFEREQAEKLARDVSGVQRVDNQIRVLPRTGNADKS